MMVQIDRWLQLSEVAKMFGLSEESIKRLAKTHGLPLRRVTPFATPGALESELVKWLKAQPRIGAPVRSKSSAKSKRTAQYIKHSPTYRFRRLNTGSFTPK